ncbi:hypothetical protein N7532_007376 [Penicillium argentinense]|uniref:Uncharacterized protein n=1 Tax=Penicillium argentinense TaxID=1131581 RepID=A0A9W9K6Z4_9EURO|nr:uncharacterized protein N7532_007376 [Penicillium argentinense]KAJ5095085.1 hypothetical protein N7532_007376 [Penicillium argentinense]
MDTKESEADESMKPQEFEKDESTTDPKREARLKTLTTMLETLTTQIASTESMLAEVTSKLQNNPSTTVKKHIDLLHAYNEIKDVGLGLMGLIAEARGCIHYTYEREYCGFIIRED